MRKDFLRRQSTPPKKIYVSHGRTQGQRSSRRHEDAVSRRRMPRAGILPVVRIEHRIKPVMRRNGRGKMKYFAGCDAGSTYTKCVIIDENGKIVSDVTNRSRINAVLSAEAAVKEAIDKVPELNSAEDLTYLVGTGYGRNKVPFADENISEISCHAMGVHVADPTVRAIIDIGGQDIKGIAVAEDGTVLNFAMNDKCSAGTGRFFEAMANAFEMSLEDFSNLSLSAKNVIPITSQCTVFAESEVISLAGDGKPMEEIAAGIETSVAKRCFVMAKKAGATDRVTLTGGCAKNAGLKKAIEQVVKVKVVDLPIDPQLMGALGAAEFARVKGMNANA